MESRNAERVRLRAERVRLRAERDKLRAADPLGLAEAWVMIEGLWSGTAARARKLREPVLHEQVNGEWSFVQTQRHLVLATDCWLRRMVKGIARPYHPWGLGGSWLTSPRRWGLDPDADPPLDQVLARVMAVVTRAVLAWSRLPRTRARWTGMWWSPRLTGSSAAATCMSAWVSTPPVMTRASTMVMPSLFSG